MADNVLRFEFLASDHFSPTADKVEHKLDNMGERIGAVGKAAAFALGKVAVGGLAAFGYEMVKGVAAAATYQALQLKTAAVIKSTGDVAHISVSGIDELAHKLQETSGVEESLIINSENVLATFTNIRNQTGKNNDIYNQATARILDLSVAMGEDLQTATVQVGKALNDPVKGMTALQRVGVTFNATQKEQIKGFVASGNIMGAQKIILRELSKEFGGAAKAAGAGFSGSLARLKEAIDDTFRDMATKLLPVLTSAASWLAERLPGAISATGKAFSVLGGWLAVVGRNVALPAFKLLVSIFQTLGVRLLAFGKVYGPPVLLFFKTLGVYFGTLVKTYGPIIVAFFKSIGDRLAALGAGKVAIAALAGAIGGLLLPIVGLLAAAFVGLAISVWSAIAPLLPFLAIGAAVGAVAYLIATNWAKVTAIFSVFSPVLSIFIHYFRDMLLPALRDAGAKVFPAIREAVASVSAAFKGHEDIIQAFGKVFMFILKALGVALAVLGVLIVKVIIPVIAELLVLVLKAVGPIVNALLTITSVLIKVVSGIASFVSNVAVIIGRVVAAILAPWIKADLMLFHAGQVVIGGLISGVVSYFTFVVKAIAATVNAIRNAWNAAGTWLVNAGHAILSGLIAGLQAVWPHLLIALGHTIDLVYGPFKPALTWLVHAGIALLTGLINGAESYWHVVTSWIGSRISAIIGFFSPAIRWLVSAGVGTLRGLVNGFTSFYGNVSRTVHDFIARYVQAPFNSASGWLVQRGRDLLTGLSRGIQSLGEWLRRNIINIIASKIRAPFVNAFNFLFNAGWNIIQGLYGGITSAIKNVRAWVSSHIVTPIINAVKWFFGISSPSRVMSEIGGHLIGGLIIGLMKHNPVQAVTKIFGGMPTALGYIVKKGLVSIASLPGKALKALGNLGSDVLGKLGISFGGNPGAVTGYGKGVNQWGGLVRQILQKEGLSPSLLGKVLSQMQTESGGNPRAINLWDSNAKAGTPSKGLMQVIDPTFRAFHWPGTSWNIYDPVANISAALNYARHRYGPNLSGLGQGHGYDQGGIARGRGVFAKYVSDPERILSPRQTKWFERAMSHGVTHGVTQHTGLTVVLNAPNYVGSRNELLDEFNRFARQGRLDAIVRMAGR